MVTFVTRGIKVSVESFYQNEYSNALTRDYMFAYSITIKNNGAKSVRLLRRHWFIVEGFGNVKQVEGEGVVGEQPILLPGESFQYVSGCGLKTEIGKMYGNYLIKEIDDNSLFYVTIPEFKLICNEKLN